MSRSEFDDRIKKDDNKRKPGIKVTIEKGIILGAFTVIIFTLFLLPKYDNYRMNEELLKEKTRTSSGYPEQMTEEKYLAEVEIIRVRLENCTNNIPESIDSAGLYEAIIAMANEADIELVSLTFKSINTEIADALGLQIISDFTETEKIWGPDKRILANCPIVFVSRSDEASCIRFIQALQNHQPMIKILDLEIKGEDPKIKTMSLELESYGILDQGTIAALEQP
ncbi:MAG: hypothetical protein ACOH15_11270 [Acetobacterium sp.]